MSSSSSATTIHAGLARACASRLVAVVMLELLHASCHRQSCEFVSGCSISELAGVQRCLAISTLNFEFRVQKCAGTDAPRRRRLRRDAPWRATINLAGEGLDHAAECGKSGHQCAARGHVEVGEVEAGGDRATAQSEAFANDASGLEGAG